MNSLKIKISYKVRDTKFKAENSYKIDTIDSIYDLIALDYETLMYIDAHMNIYKSEFKYKLNNEEWQHYNCYDYCLYLKNKFFKNRSYITEYTLLNKLMDIGYLNFILYIKEVRDNEE